MSFQVNYEGGKNIFIQAIKSTSPIGINYSFVQVKGGFLACVETVAMYVLKL